MLVALSGALYLSKLGIRGPNSWNGHILFSATTKDTRVTHQLLLNVIGNARSGMVSGVHSASLNSSQR
jgi:hypothetical protein